MWDGQQSRQLLRRIVVEGQLVLETPAHFGSGDEAGSLLPLILDEVSGKPLLTGASIAGALRSYLWKLENGYATDQTRNGLATRLFGGIREDDEGAQSSLITDDAYGENGQVELRDGVKINPQSRTAEKDKLYTFMVWAAGVTFGLRFELLIAEKQQTAEAELRQGLANALNGLQKGEITLGARKHRGFGRITVAAWHVREFDLKQPDDLVGWVKDGGKALAAVPGAGNIGKDIFELLKAKRLKEDKREKFSLTATFGVKSSLLIRADSPVVEMGHLYSNGKPVLSGTSLAGVIRARALKIAQTLKITDATSLIDNMFGVYGDNRNQKTSDEKRIASRVVIEEHEIQGGELERWVQSRVAIDRFTGGALDTALFDQQPHFGGIVQIKLELRNPANREIGLLLLVLKDLWTGDLPVGGESSVGRGRLQGQSATLQHKDQQWVLSVAEKEFKIEGDKTELQKKYVSALIPSKEATPA